jgi:hypothetical protein
MRSSESPRSPNRLLAEHGYAYGGRSGEPLGLMSPGLALSPLSLGNNSSSGGGLSSLTRVISLPESNERGDYTGMNMSDVDNTSSHRERPGATSDDDERPHPRIFSPRPFAPIRPWDEPRDRMQVDDEDGAHSNTVRRSFGHTRSALGLVAEPGTDDDERMPERMPSQTLSGSVSPVHRLHGLSLPPAHRSYSHGAADSSGELFSLGWDVAELPLGHMLNLFPNKKALIAAAGSLPWPSCTTRLSHSRPTSPPARTHMARPMVLTKPLWAFDLNVGRTPLHDTSQAGCRPAWTPTKSACKALAPYTDLFPSLAGT